MNNENKYQFINNLPKEYQRILWSIMIKAESNKFVSYCEKLTKQDCKLIMRYLYKKDKENETLKAKLEIGKTCGFCIYYDYKSRCKKANDFIQKYQQTIENIRKEKFYTLNLGVDDLKEFKNILNGSDEK